MNTQIADLPRTMNLANNESRAQVTTANITIPWPEVK